MYKSSNEFMKITYWFHYNRSQWPYGLNQEMSSLSQTLGLWVRIPLEAWRAVCVYCVYVVLCR
jgi:hypothetical protein